MSPGSETARFSIRLATDADIASIVDVLHWSFAEFAGIFDPPSGALSETEESIRAKLLGSKAFVALQNSQVTGCVFCEPGEDEFYLFRLAVLPDFRGTGVGRSLVAKVEEEARRVRARSVRLGTRLAVPKNISYYKALGYQHVGEGIHPATGTPFYAIMVKQLSPDG